MKNFRFTNAQRDYLSYLVEPRYELVDIEYDDKRNIASAVCRRAGRSYTRRVILPYEMFQLISGKESPEMILERTVNTPGILP